MHSTVYYKNNVEKVERFFNNYNIEAGILHDMGKETKKFDNYINKLYKSINQYYNMAVDIRKFLKLKYKIEY